MWKKISKICKREKREDKAEKKKKKALKNNAAEVPDPLELLEEELPLQHLCRWLVQTEEQMMTEGGLSDEDQTQLRQDLDRLWTQIRAEVQKSFDPGLSGAGLRAAVLCVLQQEEMDRRWLGLDSELVPVWRPNRTLLDHNEVLGNMVQARLSQRPLQDGAGDTSEAETAAEEPKTESEEASDQDSEDVTLEVCRLAAQVRQDLLYLQRAVSPCYPEHMDILNMYLLLYHRGFSSRLEQLARAPVDDNALYCLLKWANHRYPRDILDPELEGKVNTDSLGPLLPTELVQKLQDQYLTNTQNKTEVWLQKALKIEEDSWIKPSRQKDSPLASDVLQVLISSLLRVSCLGPEQSQTVTAHLDSFLCRYVASVEEFVEGNHSNVGSVVKAQLVCEEQFREFVLNQKMDELKKQSSLNSLDALRDCGYCSLTSGIRSKLKEFVSGLWTGPWLDGSLLVVDSLLDFVDQKCVERLSDLKPSCTQWLMGRLHRDVALRYFKNLLKTKRRSPEEQVGGAIRMKDDVNKMNAFFTQQGSGSDWVSRILLHVAEVLRLQDPDSVQLELVSLVQFCPDLSSAHVSRLLLLKSGLSCRSIRYVRRSVEENRPLKLSANHSPPFFSHLKVKWISVKMNQLELSTCRS